MSYRERLKIQEINEKVSVGIENLQLIAQKNRVIKGMNYRWLVAKYALTGKQYALTGKRYASTGKQYALTGMKYALLDGHYGSRGANSAQEFRRIT